MKTDFILAFILCFVGYFVHTIAHLLEHGQGRLKKSKIFMAFIVTFVFTGFFAWIYMIYSDPVRINLSHYITLPIGLTITIAGLVPFIAARMVRKGFTEEDHLITTGVYSILRHPLYIGAILLNIGIPLMFNGLMTLLSSVIWIVFIVIWMKIDEATLGRIYGEEYTEYKKKTLF